MKKIVFFKTDAGPVPAEDFIPAQPAVFQEALRSAADRLSQGLPVEGPRAYPHGPDAWSLWLDDDRGERTQFILYTSSLAPGSAPAPTPAPDARLRFGVYVQQGQAQGAWEEFVPAADYIRTHYSGAVQSQLLDALRRAENRLPAFDAALEWTTDGVILRALKDEQDRRLFQAELRLVRERAAG